MFAMSGSQYRLAPSVTISDCPSEVFCARFSTDGKFVAAGCGDGGVRIFNAATGRQAYSLNVKAGGMGGLPTTGIRFRPIGAASKTRNVMLVGNSDGSVSHWHMTSGKCLHSIVDEDNQIYAIDYRQDGGSFATAGRDKKVRVFDEATKTLVTELGGGYSEKTSGHSNRVFSLKFHPLDENVLLSAGWDNTVQMWDVRMEQMARHLFGPHICGDAMDIRGNTIATGSWRPERALELWDYGSGQLIENVPWHASARKGEPCMLYAAQFSPDVDGALLAAGGSGANEAKVFDRQNSNSLVGTITGLSRGVFTLDFAPDSSQIVVAGGDSTIRIIDVMKLDDSELAVGAGGAEVAAEQPNTTEPEQASTVAGEEQKTIDL